MENGGQESSMIACYNGEMNEPNEPKYQPQLNFGLQQVQTCILKKKKWQLKCGCGI